MKKMKTKAELKSVGDFLKTGGPATGGGGGGGQDLKMLPLPLTCGLCYKVGLRRPPDISYSPNTIYLMFRISFLSPRLKIMKKTIPPLKEYPGFKSLLQALKKT